MDFDQYDEKTAARAKAVLDRVDELKSAFSLASSDSERDQLLQEMQKLNQNMTSVMMEDNDDFDNEDDDDPDSYEFNL